MRISDWSSDVCSSDLYAREFLKQQLDEAAIRLADSEREALDYARRTRIIDASNAAGTESDGTPPKSLVTATLVKLNQDYAEAVARSEEHTSELQSLMRRSYAVF